jgi:tetratricopeptide (TPR) repeat protein
MRSLLLGALLFSGWACAQSGPGNANSAPANAAPDPAYAALDKAYTALRVKDYDTAVASFYQGVAASPQRSDIRKDLGYTLLKAGDTTAARDQFREAMRLDPADTHLALEYAFLCYETREPVEARRVFERLSKLGNETAKAAFENVDRPLRDGIARWKAVVAQAPDNFSGHEELARLAEQRDELTLSATEYEAAWRLRPGRRDLLLDLGRVWREQGRMAPSNAALLAASRGAEPRVAEAARALLPDRYPFVYEFEAALELDPTNAELRRELAYLHQAMGNERKATAELASVVETPEEPVTSPPPTVLAPVRAAEVDTKALAQASFDKGYLNDAARYFEAAHEANPADYSVMLKLGWTYNLLHQDKQAVRWFDFARRSPNVAEAKEARTAFQNLTLALQPSKKPSAFRTSVWMFPLISTRWKDAFAYAQAKIELNRGVVRPYLSVRFIGDVRGPIRPFAGAGPQYLSERSAIFAVGVTANTWHGVTPWFEVGKAISYQTGLGQSDFRGGLSYAKTVHRRKLFAETTDDFLYVSRFSKDTLLYAQNRIGWTIADNLQVYWNANLNTDVKRQYWANTTELGPGFRFRPPSSVLQKVQVSVNFLRGVYLRNSGNPYGPNYNDIRIGVWYAFSH